MADEKRFYWLKLRRDFFKRHDVSIIEDMDNGKDYLIFYLKLLCESIDHDGNLRFSNEIPYTDKMLASVTKTNVDIVRSALKIFTELDMIEVREDKTIYMTELPKMLGSEAASTIRSRECRDRQKELLPAIPSVPKSNAERQAKFRAKKVCENNPHVPYIEDYANNKRYGGNYYICFKRDKCQCSICGSTDNLCIHHIDGYFEDKPENNNKNKLITLCRKCHRQVHEGKEIPVSILESIDYFENNNESNVTCNGYATLRNGNATQEKELDKEIELEEVRKKEDINNIYINHAREEETYESIMNDFEVEQSVRPMIWNFIKHCQLNGRTLTNDKLSNILFEMDKQRLDEDEKIKALQTAINGGYFDIKRI